MPVWITSIFSLIASIIGWFTKPDERDVAEQVGEISGKAQQAASDEAQEVTAANASVATSERVGGAAAQGPTDLDAAIEQAKGGQI